MIYIRPEVRQGGFQRSLSGDIPLVGSEGLDVACINVVIGRTLEEMDPSVLERPDVPIPVVKTKASIIRWHLM